MSQKPLLHSENPQVFADEVRLAIGDTVVGRVNTTDATVTTLATIPLKASYTYLIEARVVARRTGGSAGAVDDGAVYVIRGGYTMVGGVATAISGTTPQAAFTDEDQAGWAATLDTSGTTVRVRVTGAVNNNVTWIGKVTVMGVTT